MVYQPIIGILIRVTYGLLLLAISFSHVLLIQRNINDFKLKLQLIPIAILIIAATLAILVPNRIIGERLSAFVGVSGIINLTLSITTLSVYSIGVGIKKIMNQKTEPNKV